MGEGGPRGDVLARFAAADPWAPVSQEGLPPGLNHAIDTSDWPTVKAKLAAVMDGLSTDGPYGRALLQAVQRLPIGVDPVFDRYRAAVAIDHGDWDALRRCLEASPYNAHELEAFREALLSPVTQFVGRPMTLPDAAPFLPYELELTGRVGWYRQWARRLAAFDARSRFSRPDVPAGRHLRYRPLHHAVLLSAGEATGGSLHAANALAREGQRLGDEGEPLRDMARDLEDLTALALGHATVDFDPRVGHRTPLPHGLSPLGTFEWLLHLMPFLSLRSDEWLASAAHQLQSIATRFGSPKAQLIAHSWVAAAQSHSTEPVRRPSELPGVLSLSRQADPGLRVLPELLSAQVSRNYSSLEHVERLARSVGNVWAQVSALTWMAARDPSPSIGRRYLRLLSASGWRRPALAPASVVAEAVLGMTALGLRSQVLVEVAVATGRPVLAADVAMRHAGDVGLRLADRIAAVEILARIGSTQARGSLAELARRPDEVGQSARAAIVRPPRGVGLTAREIEVLNLAGEGLTNREIAIRLGLSPHTIARHLSNARDKLGAVNRADAAVKLDRMTGPPRDVKGRGPSTPNRPEVSVPYRRA